MPSSSRVIRRPRLGGFTYLWTLLLVALLALGLTKGAEVYGTTLQREREQELLFVGRQFREAIGSYYDSQISGGQKQYPSKLEDLLRDNRFPGLRRHLRKIYADPITGKTQWGFVRVSGRIAGVYSLSESAPLKQDNFEAGELSFRGKESYKDWRFTYPPDLSLRSETQVPGSGTQQRQDGMTPAELKPISTTPNLMSQP